jgi:rubrerythrin
MRVNFDVEGNFHIELEDYVEEDKNLYLATIRQSDSESPYQVEVICGKPYRALGRMVEKWQRYLASQAEWAQLGDPMGEAPIHNCPECGTPITRRQSFLELCPLCRAALALPKEPSS